MIYECKWKNRFPSHGVKANDAVKELERIRKQGGGVLTAEAVVDRSKDANAVLHPLFTWPNAKAAAEHRLEQARTMMRSVVVVVDGAEEEPFRHYLCIQNTDDEDDDAPSHVYVRTIDAMADPVMRDGVLADAVQRLDYWIMRWKAYGELGGLVSDMTALLSKYRTRKGGRESVR